MVTDAASTSSIRTGTIEANGLTFAYREAGEGPLALCLHGFPDSAHTWDLLLPALADAGYHAVAPFLRGYAPTEVPADGLYQMGAVATDAIALHEAFGGDGDAVLIGHDWGALASYSVAASAPERWRRMVTLAVPPPATVTQGFFTYDQLRKSWYMFFFQSPLADMVVPMDDLAFIDRLWADWSPGFEGGAFLAATKDALRDPANLTAAIGYYRATLGAGPHRDDYDAVEAAGAGPISVPTLYLHGIDDGCMGSELVTEAMLASLPAKGSRIELVANAGHFLQIEQPEIVNQLILDFLAG